VHYVLVSRKNYQHGLDVGPLEFQLLWPRAFLTNPFRILALCFGVTGKTSCLISQNNPVKKIFVSIGHRDMSWEDVTRSSLCSSVKDCGIKHTHNFLFPKSSFTFQRTTVLGMFKDSAIVVSNCG
jgi:hypothetical protein